MPRAHALVGWLFVAVFIGTGVYLLLRMNSLVAAHGETLRYAIRANHVYILLSALMNLAVATTRSQVRPGWRRRLATPGHALVLLAPPVLFAGFIVEGHHPSPVRPFTSGGVLLLAAGVVLIVVSRARADRSI